MQNMNKQAAYSSAQLVTTAETHIPRCQGTQDTSGTSGQYGIRRGGEGGVVRGSTSLESNRLSCTVRVPFSYVMRAMFSMCSDPASALRMPDTQSTSRRGGDGGARIHTTCTGVVVCAGGVLVWRESYWLGNTSGPPPVRSTMLPRTTHQNMNSDRLQSSPGCVHDR